MVRVEVRQHAIADPASVALLLAGQLHQDGRAIHDVDDAAATPDRVHLVTDAETPVVSPPRRNGVGFKAEVVVATPAGARATGELTIEPAADAGCDVTVRLDVADAVGAKTASRRVRRFLSEVADRARSRSYAA
ncbi:MAG TPA: hypothetical protein VG708_04975 [Mycobacteriales bacterium]|nr:hypothetical protein [Mycobacteriales bacterium]